MYMYMCIVHAPGFNIYSTCIYMNVCACTCMYRDITVACCHVGAMKEQVHVRTCTCICTLYMLMCCHVHVGYTQD